MEAGHKTVPQELEEISFLLRLQCATWTMVGRTRNGNHPSLPLVTRCR